MLNSEIRNFRRKTKQSIVNLIQSHFVYNSLVNPALSSACGLWQSTATVTDTVPPNPRGYNLEPISPKEQLALLEVFDNPRPEREYRITHTCHEFTSVCPKTGQPDFGTIEIEYTPGAACLELKSLKYYMQAFRNQGIFYEAVTNRILDDLVAACGPRYMVVRGNFSVRGGFSSIITAEYTRP